jgi:hypothetical protein
MLLHDKPAAEQAGAAQVITRLREHALGPTRFMNLYSCYELGIFDLFREHPAASLTAQQIADSIGVAASPVEQLLHLLVKEDLVSYDESTASYTPDGIAKLTDAEFARIIRLMTMVKVVCLRQLYYLSDSIRTGQVVGLKKFYGFEGTLYEACLEHEDLRAAWAEHMDQTTSLIDPWFFENVPIRPGSRVLDLAGHTGLGAILTYQHNRSENLHVACFDFPEKEADALQNFRAHNVEEHCSYIGGDVFEGLPRGFDTVLIKHFLDQFGQENVFRILTAVHDCLEVGGQVYVLVPTYPEDVKSSSQADFFPAYFLGCSMGEGGPQKLSTYKQWMEACGFEITSTRTHDIASKPPDMVHVHSIICGTKVAS